jgi:hypothetical protein
MVQKKGINSIDREDFALQKNVEEAGYDCFLPRKLPNN